VVRPIALYFLTALALHHSQFISRRKRMTEIRFDMFSPLALSIQGWTKVIAALLYYHSGQPLLFQVPYSKVKRVQ